jgi:transcriptional regulator with XRE-family HTH domain
VANQWAAQRKAAGLEQTQLAARLGVTVRTLSRWETGDRQPDHPVLLDLALRYLVLEHAIAPLLGHGVPPEIAGHLRLIRAIRRS